MDAMTHTDSVGKLGKALTQLTEKRRFFRSLNQWTVAFLRFTFAAMAVGLFMFEIAALHMFVVVRRTEDEKQRSDDLNIADGRRFLPMYCDELLCAELIVVTLI